MKIRRIKNPAGEFQYQTETLDGWTDCKIPTTVDAITRENHQKILDSESQLPFTPASFRDFMLYEKHVQDATRGMVKRYFPNLFRLTSLYEGLTGKVYPKFNPKPIWYKQPIYYMSNHLNFVVSGEDVKAPGYTNALDYELELGFVLKAPLFNAAPETALKAIGGFVVLNDFSARDVQLAEMNSGFGPQKAKHFMSSMSEVMVLADNLLHKINELTGAVYINDIKVSEVSSSGMQHSIGKALAHASHGEQLYAGELFGSGTLPGGSGLENGHWLQPGDQLRLELSDIGEIEHRIF